MNEAMAIMAAPAAATAATADTYEWACWVCLAALVSFAPPAPHPEDRVCPSCAGHRRAAGLDVPEVDAMPKVAA